MRRASPSSKTLCKIAKPGWSPGGKRRWAVAGRAPSSTQSRGRRPRGSVVSWKFILKMFNHEGEGWQEGSTDPMAWNFWKREWLVYQAPWIRELREGLVTPHCFGFGELGETAVWVAMEDLTAADQRPWSASRFAASARHLGGFNGRFLVNADPPADSCAVYGQHDAGCRRRPVRRRQQGGANGCQCCGR
jgi:hypothetical protein